MLLGIDPNRRIPSACGIHKRLRSQRVEAAGVVGELQPGGGGEGGCLCHKSLMIFNFV
jgi:hypothetical protein